MKPSLVFLALFLLVNSAAAFTPSEVRSFSVEPLKEYNGREISEIKIQGLERTAEQAVFWLLGARTGDRFDSEKWVEGITKLYNTSVLYDIRTEITPDLEKIKVLLILKDKWTLFPYASVQGGGGATSWSFGLYDSNLGGYFSNLSVGGSSYNGALGYDVNYYQEWFRDTDWIFGFDFQKNLSMGAGIRINFVKIAGALLRLDYAKTLYPNDGDGISFGVGQFF